MRAEVRGSSPIQWVLKLQRALAASNFVRYFALVRQAPYLLACLSHIYFGPVRAVPHCVVPRCAMQPCSCRDSSSGLNHSSGLPDGSATMF